MFIRLSAYEASVLREAIHDYLKRCAGAEDAGLEAGNQEILQGIVEKLCPEQRQHVALAMVVDRTNGAFGIVVYNGPGKKLTVEDTAGHIGAELPAAKNIDDAAEIIRQQTSDRKYTVHWYS